MKSAKKKTWQRVPTLPVDIWILVFRRLLHPLVATCAAESRGDYTSARTLECFQDLVSCCLTFDCILRSPVSGKLALLSVCLRPPKDSHRLDVTAVDSGRTVQTCMSLVPLDNCCLLKSFAVASAGLFLDISPFRTCVAVLGFASCDVSARLAMLAVVSVSGRTFGGYGVF